MNKVNYLALGAVALTLIAVFSPWLEVYAAGLASDLNDSVQPVVVHGISIGYGIFGMLVALLGGFLVYKEYRWTFVAGIVNFIDGYGYLHEWFGAGTHDSGNYGDVTSRSAVDPRFGIYLFIVASLAFIVFTLKYYKMKKPVAILPSEPIPDEFSQPAYAQKSAAHSQVYQPSNIQPMTTSSTETPSEKASTETPNEQVPATEKAVEQSAESTIIPEPVIPTEPLAPTVPAEPASPTAPVQPKEVPAEPAKVIVHEAAPAYHAPKESSTPHQHYVEPEKKKSSTAWIYILIMVLVLAGAGVYVMTNTTSQKSQEKTEQSINDEKARLQIIINEVNQDVSDRKYDDALLKINSINWLYDPTANKGYVDQYNSQRENLRNTIEQLKSNQSLDDQKHAADKANEQVQQPIQSSDSIH
jgi:hypothetical protein